MAIDTVSITAQSAAPAAPPIQAFNHPDGPSFSDVLDILNPLQHIPIINTLYRHITGDEEGAVADVAGGTLWSGPIGLVSSLIDLSVKAETGKSIGDTVLGWLGLDDEQPSGTALAANDVPPPAQAQAQAQAQTMQQTAVAAAIPVVTTQNLPPPARVRTASPEDAQKDDEKGPQKLGDYMVFGAAGGSSARLLNANLGQKPADLMQDKGAQNKAMAAGYGRQGDYLVFGASSMPAPGNAVAAMAATPAMPAGGPIQLVASADNTKPAAPQAGGGFMVFGANQPAAITPEPLATPTIPANNNAMTKSPAAAPAINGPARAFPAPARRNPSVPTVLPPPTTGPAALPGHGPSQAINTASDESWFINAMTAGLNKYQAAQKLTQNDRSDDEPAQDMTIH